MEIDCTRFVIIIVEGRLVEKAICQNRQPSHLRATISTLLEEDGIAQNFFAQSVHIILALPQAAWPSIFYVEKQ